MDFITLFDVPALRSSLAVQRQTRNGNTRPYSIELGMLPDEHATEIDKLRKAAGQAIRELNGKWNKDAECQSAITTPDEITTEEWDRNFIGRYKVEVVTFDKPAVLGRDGKRAKNRRAATTEIDDDYSRVNVSIWLRARIDDEGKQSLRCSLRWVQRIGDYAFAEAEFDDAISLVPPPPQAEPAIAPPPPAGPVEINGKVVKHEGLDDDDKVPF